MSIAIIIAIFELIAIIIAIFKVIAIIIAIFEVIAIVIAITFNSETVKTREGNRL